MLTVIDSLLDDHRVAGISYDACFLTKRQTDADYDEEVEKGCGAHASVIVGRKWNTKTNSCEYKVRNSWGTSCGGYVPEIKARCRKGNFYLTEEELADHLTGVSWLK